MAESQLILEQNRDIFGHIPNEDLLLWCDKTIPATVNLKEREVVYHHIDVEGSTAPGTNLEVHYYIDGCISNGYVRDRVLEAHLKQKKDNWLLKSMMLRYLPVSPELKENVSKLIGNPC